MNTICIDTETFYSDECTVKTLGNHNYVRHPDWDCYMVSVAGDNGLRFVGYPEDAPWDKIFNPEHRLISHNTGFDEAVIERLYELGYIPKPEYAVWDDTADLVCYLGYPRGLKAAAKALLGVEMSKDVRDNMKGKRFSELSDAKKKEVEDYALGDAVNTLALWTKYADQWPEEERWLSRHTRMMGQKGLPINKERLQSGIESLTGKIDDAVAAVPWFKDTGKVLSREDLERECAKVGVIVPKSLAKDDPECIAWEDEYGDELPFLGAVRNYRRCNMFREKLLAIQNRIKNDGCSLLNLKYFGGHTGRWSGDGGVNYQNMPRGEMFGVNMRELIEAPKGKTFVVVDLSQIEARITLWFAQDKATLDLIRGGMDLYEAHARATMGYNDPMKLKDYDKLHGTSIRQMAKVRVLGLGFGCGWEKFIHVAKIMGNVTLSPSESQETVLAYRQSNKRITALWRKLEGHLARHASTGQDALFELPSGRSMAYRDIRRTGSKLTTVACQGGSLFRKSIWGGVLTENCLAGGTTIVTDGGSKVLRDLAPDDLVWDGEAFVRHGGLVNRGSQETIEVHGVRATPDHKFLTSNGWSAAESVCNLPVGELVSSPYELQSRAYATKVVGANLWETDGSGESAEKNQKNRVASSMPVREPDCSARDGSSSRETYLLRPGMPDISVRNSETQRHSRKNEAPPLCYMAIHARSLSSTESSIVEKLRSPGDNSISGVGSFREVLGGYESSMETRPGLGQIGQQQGLRQGELPLGVAAKELPEQTEYSETGRMAGELSGRIEEPGSKTIDYVLPNKARLGLGEDVFDILNCGPNHRFVVIGDTGTPLVASNCVQATARDVLAYYIRQLTEDGLDIRLHVHDEIVIMCDEAEAPKVLSHALSVMSVPPPWIADLPIEAEGSFNNLYTK